MSGGDEDFNILGDDMKIFMCIFLLICLASAKTPMIGDQVHAIANGNHYRGIVTSCDLGLLCLNCTGFPINNGEMTFAMVFIQNESGEYYNMGDGWIHKPMYKNFCLGISNLDSISWET